VALLANLPIKVVQHLITRQHLGNAAHSADDHLDKKRNTPMTISGRTKLIAHLGYPTESFKAPMIYNPYFERYDIDAVVVPMGCKAEDYPAFLKLAFKLSNIHGALVTMPHKVLLSRCSMRS